MLPVSTAWRNLFNNVVLPEAFLKIVIDTFGTFEKKDIFNYQFTGQNDPCSLTFPSYEANATFNNQSGTFDTPSDYIGKKVEIYYGFMVNNAIEYRLAQTMFVSDYLISDNGLQATLYFKSNLAKLTATIGEEKYKEYDGGTGWTYVKNSVILNNELTATGLTFLLSVSLRDFDVKALPNNITIGEYCQISALLHRSFLRVLANGAIEMNNLSGAYSFNSKNVLVYPHIEAIKYTNVNVVVPDYDNGYFSTQEIGYVYGEAHRVNPQYPYVMDTKTITLSANKGYINETNLCFTLKPYNLTTIDIGTLEFKNNQITISFVATGVQANSSVEVYVKSFNDMVYSINQDTLAISSPMIFNATQGGYVKTFVEKYYKNTKRISLNLRINPAFELLDKMSIDGLDDFIIDYMQITFNGTFSGVVKGIIFN